MTTIVAKELGVHEFMMQREHHNRKATEHNKDIIVAVLKRMGVTKVELYYQGRGYSGTIESCDFEGLAETNQIPISEALKRVQTEYLINTEHDGWALRMEDFTPKSVRDMIEEFFYGLLDTISEDITNNDGGNASLTIRPMTGEISMEVTQNFMTSEDYSYEFNLEG